MSRWEEAFAVAGIDPAFYHRRRSFDEVLPWDHLDCGVSKEYLRDELAKGLEGAFTPDCRSGCTGCGVCNFNSVRMRLHDTAGALERPPQRPPLSDEAARVRVRFSKTGAMKYLSHLEMIGLFSRAVARAQLPIRFSQGFHPHPKFSFATALSVGVESHAEYMDMEMEAGFGGEKVMDGLNRVLPEGVRILEWQEIPLRAQSLSVIIKAVRYRVTLHADVSSDLSACAERFLALEGYPFQREKKGKVTQFDLRHELAALTASATTLEMVITRGKPLEFAAAITGVAVAELGDATVEKLDVVFAADTDSMQ